MTALSAFVYLIRSQKGYELKIYLYCPPKDGSHDNKAIRLSPKSYLNFNNEYAFYIAQKLKYYNCLKLLEIISN